MKLLDISICIPLLMHFKSIYIENDVKNLKIKHCNCLKCYNFNVKICTMLQCLKCCNLRKLVLNSRNSKIFYKLLQNGIFPATFSI